MSEIAPAFLFSGTMFDATTAPTLELDRRSPARYVERNGFKARPKDIREQDGADLRETKG